MTTFGDNIGDLFPGFPAGDSGALGPASHSSPSGVVPCREGKGREGPAACVRREQTANVTGSGPVWKRKAGAGPAGDTAPHHHHQV